MYLTLTANHASLMFYLYVSLSSLIMLLSFHSAPRPTYRISPFGIVTENMLNPTSGSAIIQVSNRQSLPCDFYRDLGQSGCLPPF